MGSVILGSCLQDCVYFPRGIALAPDGTLYIAESGASDHRISKIDANGVLSTVFATTSLPTDIAVESDGRLVVSYNAANKVERYDANGQNPELLLDGSVLSGPTGVEIGQDGALFVSDTGHGRVIRRDAGGAWAVYATMTSPWGLAVRGDSLIVGGGSGTDLVRIVDPNGNVRIFAGGGNPPTGVGDGGLATDAELSDPQYVLAAPDGSVYISEEGGQRVRRVSPDGFIRTVAGTGANACNFDTAPATASPIWGPEGLALAPDGSLYLAQYYCGVGTISRIASPDFGTVIDAQNDMVGVPSEDGSELYVFWGYDGGRHVATLDAVTGQLRYSFDYGSYTVQGNTVQLPTAVHDLRGATNGTGRTLTINRDLNGKLTSFASAGNQTTSAYLDTHGFLWYLTRPAVTGKPGSLYGMLYNPPGYPVDTGLLSDFYDPNYQPHSFGYDPSGNGKLVQDRDPYTPGPDPAPAFKTLARTALASGDGYRVDVQTYSGLSTAYNVESTADGNKSWSMTGPDSRAVTSVTEPDEKSTITYPDNTVVTVTKQPDPRFGTSALVPSTTIVLPSGADLSVNRTRATSPSVLTNPLEFDTLTETVTLSDAGLPDLAYTTLVTRNGSAQNVVLTTPQGRSFVADLDMYGRVTSLGLNQTNPVVADRFFGFDTAGRLNTITQGNRRVTVTWSGDFISSLAAGPTSNPQWYHVGTAFDGRGELKTITRNDSRQIILDYDPASNLTLLQRPGENGAVSQYFTPNNVDLLDTYNGPDVTSSVSNNGETHYAWDQERRLDSVTWTDGTGVDLQYFASGTAEAGKLHYLKTLTGTTLSTYAYHTASDQGQNGRLYYISTPSSPQTIYTYFAWDGPALKQLQTRFPSGTSKTVGFGLGDYLRLDTETVTNGSTVTYQYDNDGMITHAAVSGADLTLTRNAQTGWVDSTSVQSSRQTLSRTPTYGQLSSVTTRTSALLSNIVHTLTISGYDDLGRITGKVDRVLTGMAPVITYSYDSVGRLTGDGTTTWGYDYNGNRTTVNGQTVASYDIQDRLTLYNGTPYTHNANGDRSVKGTGISSTTYTYDSFHNLKLVLLPGHTTTITYDIDGLGRRIGRHRTGTSPSDRYYLYAEGNRLVAEYDGTGTIISRFVYASRSHVPDYMIQGSNIYRFVTDQLGSVRLLVNVNVMGASASIVKQINYDAWGNITGESGTIDQPFGFAGGLQDRDTGLVHFGAREYDPVTGRWLQKDPIRFRGGDTNLYAYAGNDPVNRIDPSGLYPLGGFPVENGRPPSGEGQGIQVSAGGIYYGAGAQGYAGVLMVHGEDVPYYGGGLSTGAGTGFARGGCLQFLTVWDPDGFFGLGYDIGGSAGPYNGGFLVSNGRPIGMYLGISPISFSAEVHKAMTYTWRF